MATNTCKSIVIYQDSEQYSIEPFLSERIAHAEKMFNEGKTKEEIIKYINENK